MKMGKSFTKITVLFMKTIIDFIIDQFKPYDINNFTFTLNYKTNLIKTYLKNNIKKINIIFIMKNPLGTVVHYRK